MTSYAVVPTEVEAALIDSCDPGIRAIAIPVGEVDSIMMHCISKLLEVLHVALMASALASSVGIAQIALAPHGAGNSREIQVRIATVVLDAVVAAMLIMQSCHDGGLSGSPAMRLLAFYAAVLGVFEMLELLNGFGPPDRGGEFAEGSATFSDDIYAILAQATPTFWFGEGAEKYYRKNCIQQDLVKLLADADSAIAEILSNQADQVESLRKDLANSKLAFSSATTLFAINAITNSGSPGDFYFIIAVVGLLAFGELVYLLESMVALMTESENNHKRIRSARRGYLDVIAGVKANIVSGTAAVGAPTLSACVAPDFSVLSGGMSGAVGRLDVAGVVNGSADRPADVPSAYARTSAEARERRLSSPIPQRATWATRATHDHSKPDAATKDMDVADMAARAVDAEEAGDAPAAVCAPTPVPTLAHRMGMA